METQPFFNTIAGLSISLAGFGSVIAWLREDATVWDPINLWRVKNIVRLALTMAFISLSLNPVYALTGDVATTVRFGSAAIVAAEVFDLIQNRKPDPEIWTPHFSWIIFMTLSVIHAAIHLGNLAWASVGVLQIGALVMLSSPAGIFYNFVREIGHRQPATAGPEEAVH